MSIGLKCSITGTTCCARYARPVHRALLPKGYPPVQLQHRQPGFIVSVDMLVDPDERQQPLVPGLGWLRLIEECASSGMRSTGLAANVWPVCRFRPDDQRRRRTAAAASRGPSVWPIAMIERFGTFPDVTSASPRNGGIQRPRSEQHCWSRGSPLSGDRLLTAPASPTAPARGYRDSWVVRSRRQRDVREPLRRCPERDGLAVWPVERGRGRR